MNNKSILAFATGSLATASIALLIAAGPEHTDHGHSHDHDQHDQHDMGHDATHQPDKDFDMMAEMTKLATPDEHHAELLKAVGTWTAHTKFFMDPSAPPMESEGSMTVKSVLGGRYIMSEFKMDFMGQPFEGIGYNGYSIAHGHYVATWMDSMSTKITYMTGDKDDDGNMVMMGTATTPMGDNPMKIVTTHTDEDHWTDSFYDQLPDGSWFNSGSISYTRN